MRRKYTKKLTKLLNIGLFSFFFSCFAALAVETSFECDEEIALESQIKIMGLKRSGYKKDCVASWYGIKFHGRTTANMEIFNKNAISAAHKTLPFNTYLLVTNKKNNKKLIVRINDRGPFVGDREIDLSEGAAKMLEGQNDGLLNIKYEILKRA